jgi:hypothetical protein
VGSETVEKWNKPLDQKRSKSAPAGKSFRERLKKLQSQLYGNRDSDDIPSGNHHTFTKMFLLPAYVADWIRYTVLQPK